MTPRLPRPEDFSSRLRGPGLTSRVGAWLGLCFLVAFLTGVYSHLAQDAPGWFPNPNRPVWLYQVTQGVHVGAGAAAVPLLLVKLWSVYPKLFERPPLGDVVRLARHGLERVSIAVLVAGSIFQLATGLANASQWYPWGFSFRATHYAVGWVTIGALAVHVAVKLPLIVSSLSGRMASGSDRVASETGRVASDSGLTRRGLLAATGLASGAAVLTTAGSAVPMLRDVSVFGVRSGDGPAGVPINKSAKAAGVTATALDPGYRLEVVGPGGTANLSMADLSALRRVEAELPIACVEGWSASGLWYGVRVSTLVGLVGAAPDSSVTVTSLQESGPFRVTALPGEFTADPLTLLALGLNGEPLSIDHGYPCRLITANRPGVLQTKWVRRLEVVA